MRLSVPLGALLLTLSVGSNLFAQRAQLPSDVMLGRLGLQRAWWAHASVDPLLDRVKYLLSDEQETLVQSNTGILTAFDNANGRRLWAVQVGSPQEMRFPAVTNERLALIISGSTMYALDKRTGDVAWQVQIPTAVSTAPSMDESRAYVGSVNGTVYAYDLKFLDRLSKDPRLLKESFRSLKWQYKTGARIMFPPASTGKVVLVASADASLYGLSADDRKLHFQFETDQPVSAPITQLGRLFFVATEDRKAYCLDAETGVIKWELLSGLHLRQAPRVVGDHVFLRPEGYGLRCLALANANPIWTNRQAVGFLAATPAAVYASDSLGNVMLLNQLDGRQIGAFSMRQFPIRVANERTDRLYFCSERGLVVCIREREHDFPLFHKNPDRGPILPEMAPDVPEKAAAPAKKPGEEAEMEEKKENGDASPAADADKEAAPAKPAAKPAPSKKTKTPAKPAESDSQ